MKKMLTTIAIATLALAGCTTNNPEELQPSPVRPTTAAPVETTANPEPTEVPPTDPAPEPTRQPEPTDAPTTPQPEVSTSEAGTPATEFAERWGKRYPLVPEYAILKAANGVCVMVEQYPNWTNNPIAQAGINEIVTGFGLNENDAVEFTQDAEQNYCASRSNPT